MSEVEQVEQEDQRIEAVKHIAIAMFKIDDPVIGAVTQHIARQILEALELPPTDDATG